MNNRLVLAGIPTALGAPSTGPRDSPRVIRQSEPLQRVHTESNGSLHDCGDVTVPQTSSIDDRLTGMIENARQREIVFPTSFSLTLGGDHTTSLATVNETARHGTPGLLWIDAHADYNTPETSPSDNRHGMVIANLLGDGGREAWEVPNLREENIALVGTRSIDKQEQARLRDSDISVYSMRDIHRNGIEPILDEAWDVVSTGTDRVHASLDMDVFDPSIAPGVSTPVSNGLPANTVDDIALFLAAADDLMSADIVEVNPNEDAHGKTVALAGRIAAMLLND